MKIFSKLHKYFRFFDNLDEIYEDIIKFNINSNDDLTINISTIKIKFNSNIIIKMIMKYIIF